MSTTPQHPARKLGESRIAFTIPTTPHGVRVPNEAARVARAATVAYFFGAPDDFGLSFPGQHGKQAGDDATPSAPVILVVDDDPEIRLIVGEVLAFEGYKVVEAGDGAEALCLIQRTHPDLVLLDMRMPVMDGWTFAEQLQERGIKLPIVVMTAAMDARRWATDIQAQAYLSKPFDILALLEAVSRLTTH
ncbi:MAG TPA: response regulator [Chloroflexia bacterium]